MRPVAALPDLMRAAFLRLLTATILAEVLHLRTASASHHNKIIDNPTTFIAFNHTVNLSGNGNGKLSSGGGGGIDPDATVYTSEYLYVEYGTVVSTGSGNTIITPAAGITWAEAQRACASDYGPEWSLATFPTAAAFHAVRGALLPSSANRDAWVGGQQTAAGSNAWEWRRGAGGEGGGTPIGGVGRLNSAPHLSAAYPSTQFWSGSSSTGRCSAIHVPSGFGLVPFGGSRDDSPTTPPSAASLLATPPLSQTLCGGGGNWHSSQPDYDGGASVQHCMLMWAGAGVGIGRTAHQSWMLAADAPCATTRLGAMVCERSPCKMGADCYEPNTLTMFGSYYPNCVCKCRPGAWGSRCEFPVVMNHYDVYTSEYMPIIAPGGNLFTASAAIESCRALGDGWAIASFPTGVALQERYALVLRMNVTGAAATAAAGGWVSGTDAASEGRWVHQGTNRLAGRYFWRVAAGLPTGGACVTYPFYAASRLDSESIPSSCAWPYGTSPPSSTLLNCARIDLTSSNPPLSMVATSCTQLLPVAHCERSPCKMNTDCYEPNTLSMSGTYHPNCVCKCRPGASGSKCEFPVIFDHGPYVSHYATVNGSFTYEGARSACRSQLGPEWDLATFPTTVSLNSYIRTISIAKSNLLAFGVLGGTDAAVEASWLWDAGRLKGRNFWTSGSCQMTPITSFNASITPSCAWATNEPNEPAFDCLHVYHDGNPMFHYADYNCLFTYTVAHCERSPCKMNTDCYEPNTLSIAGTYAPACTCSCRPGAWGSKCEYPIAIDHGVYTSEYGAIHGSFNLEAARTACKAKGTGYDLATFPTRSSFDKYLQWLSTVGYANPSTSNGHSWLAGTDIVTEATWIWDAGRLKGKQFWQGAAGGTCVVSTITTFNASITTTCAWAGTQPENPDGGDCMHMWVAGNPTMYWADYPCTTALGAVHCERSPCKMNTDCYEPNTLSIVGTYHPSCECKCRPGASGSKCEFPVIFDHGPYVSHYATVNGSFTYEGARSACRSQLGPEWDLATFPTTVSLNTFIQMTTWSGNNVWSWIGGTDAAVEASWLWDAGRLKGRNFWTSGSCQTSSAGHHQIRSFNASFTPSCAWSAGKPSTASHDCLRLYTEGTPTMYYTEYPCTTALGAAHCERSPCKMNTDCYEPNTLYIVGVYHPSCECKCRPGASGSKCEFPVIFDHGPYVSHYATVNGSFTYEGARSACRSQLGPEWDLATFPTSTVLDSLIVVLGGSHRTDWSWIGGTDAAVEASWLWDAGRLKGRNFWTSGSCQTTPIVAFNASLPQTNCSWAANEPTPAQAALHDCLHLATAGNPMLYYADNDCNTLNPLAHCERSPCKMNTDCYEPNTARMEGDYYPNCACICKAGYWGDRCQPAPTLIDAAPYVSEYLHVCPAPPAGGLTWSGAAEACFANGDGWMLATFSSQDSFTRFRNWTDRSPTGTYVGASDSTGEGTWRWTAGRLEGLVFHQGAATSGGTGCASYNYTPPSGLVIPLQYCMWSGSQPDNGVMGGVPAENCGYMWGESRWRLADGRCGSESSGALQPCYLCERSPCEFRLDCDGHGSIGLIPGRYFPHCHCICIKGRRGRSCSETNSMSLEITPTVTLKWSRSLSVLHSTTLSQSNLLTMSVSRPPSVSTTLATSLSQSPTPSIELSASATRQRSVTPSLSVTEDISPSTSFNVSSTASHSAPSPSASDSMAPSDSITDTISSSLSDSQLLSNSKSVLLSRSESDRVSPSTSNSIHTFKATPTRSESGSLSSTGDTPSAVETKSTSATRSSSDTASTSQSNVASLTRSDPITSSASLNVSASATQLGTPSTTPAASQTDSGTGPSRSISVTDEITGSSTAPMTPSLSPSGLTAKQSTSFSRSHSWATERTLSPNRTASATTLASSSPSVEPPGTITVSRVASVSPTPVGTASVSADRSPTHTASPSSRPSASDSYTVSPTPRALPTDTHVPSASLETSRTDSFSLSAEPSESKPISISNSGTIPSATPSSSPPMTISSVATPSDLLSRSNHTHERTASGLRTPTATKDETPTTTASISPSLSTLATTSGPPPQTRTTTSTFAPSASASVGISRSQRVIPTRSISPSPFQTASLTASASVASLAPSITTSRVTSNTRSMSFSLNPFYSPTEKQVATKSMSPSLVITNTSAAEGNVSQSIDATDSTTVNNNGRMSQTESFLSIASISESHLPNTVDNATGNETDPNLNDWLGTSAADAITDTTGLFFIGDPFSIEVQLATMFLIRPCATTSADKSMARVSRYILSPLIDLGPTVVALSHGLLSILLFATHCAVVSVIYLRSRTASPAQRASDVLNDVLARFVFPTASLGVGLLLYPGTVGATTDLLKALMSSAPSAASPSIALIVGIAHIVLVPAVMLFFIILLSRRPHPLSSPPEGNVMCGRLVPTIMSSAFVVRPPELALPQSGRGCPAAITAPADSCGDSEAFGGVLPANAAPNAITTTTELAAELGDHGDVGNALDGEDIEPSSLLPPSWYRFLFVESTLLAPVGGWYPHRFTISLFVLRQFYKGERYRSSPPQHEENGPVGATNEDDLVDSKHRASSGRKEASLPSSWCWITRLLPLITLLVLVAVSLILGLVKEEGSVDCDGNGYRLIAASSIIGAFALLTVMIRPLVTVFANVTTCCALFALTVLFLLRGVSDLSTDKSDVIVTSGVGGWMWVIKVIALGVIFICTFTRTVHFAFMLFFFKPAHPPPTRLSILALRSDAFPPENSDTKTSLGPLQVEPVRAKRLGKNNWSSFSSSSSSLSENPHAVDHFFSPREGHSDNHRCIGDNSDRSVMKYHGPSGGRSGDYSPPLVDIPHVSQYTVLDTTADNDDRMVIGNDEVLDEKDEVERVNSLHNVGSLGIVHGHFAPSSSVSAPHNIIITSPTASLIRWNNNEDPNLEEDGGGARGKDEALPSAPARHSAFDGNRSTFSRKDSNGGKDGSDHQMGVEEEPSPPIAPPLSAESDDDFTALVNHFSAADGCTPLRGAAYLTGFGALSHNSASPSDTEGSTLDGIDGDSDDHDNRVEVLDDDFDNEDSFSGDFDDDDSGEKPDDDDLNQSMAIGAHSTTMISTPALPKPASDEEGPAIHEIAANVSPSRPSRTNRKSISTPCSTSSPSCVYSDEDAFDDEDNHY